MKLRDILFTGMDIPNEVQKLMDARTDIERMTVDEKRAYKFGVSETLRAVRTLLNLDKQLVFHIEGHDRIEEFDLDDLIEIIEDKESC